MAKKKEHIDLGDMEFEDFGGWEDTDPFDEVKPNKERSPVQTATGIAYSAAKQTATDRTFIRDIMRSALPRGYTETFDLVDSAQRGTKNLYNEAMTEVRPFMRELQRAVKGVSPKLDKILPKSLAKKLKNYGDKAQSEDDRRRNYNEELIQDELRDIFDSQEEKQAAYAERESIEKAIFDKKEDKRHRTSVGILADLRALASRQVGYQDSVLSKYHRKSLEFQLRQYHVLAEMSNDAKVANKSIVSNLRDITTNTALPDFLKITKTEAGKQYVRDRLYGAAVDRFSDFSAEFGQRLGKNIRTGVMNKVGQFGTAVKASANAAREAELADSLMTEEQKRELRDEAIATVGSSLLGGFGDIIGRKLGKFTAKRPGIERTGESLSYFANNYQNILSDWARSDTDFGQRGAMLKQSIKDAIPTWEGVKFKLPQHNDAAGMAFDGQSHRTLNSIIPGLLSRILQSSEGIRTGKMDERLVFNTDRNEFTSFSTAANDVYDKVLRQSRENFAPMVNNLVDKIDEGKELSPAARSLLRQTLLKDVGGAGSGFTPRRYAEASYYKTDNKDVASELSVFIARQYGVDLNNTKPEEEFSFEQKGVFKQFKDGVNSTVAGFKQGTEGTLEQQRKKNRDLAIFNELRRYAPEIGALLSGYANSGQQEILRDLGLLKKSGTTDVVDSDFLWKYLGEQDGVDIAPRNQSGFKEEGNRSERRPESNSAAERLGRGSAGPGVGGFGGGSARGAFQDYQVDDTALAQSEESGGRVVPDIGSQIDRLIEFLTTRASTEGQDESNQILAQILLNLHDSAQGTGGIPPASSRSSRKWLGSLGRGAKWLGKKYLNLTFLPARLAGSAAKRVGGWLGGGLLNKITGASKKRAGDVYIKGELKPILTKRGMENGSYIDVRSQKPVTCFNDITGPVTDMEGNVMLSEEDFAKGLTDGRGMTLTLKALSGARSLATMGVKGYVGLMKLHLLPITLGWKVAKAAYKKNKMFFDVYVTGEPTPRLRAHLLQAGNYISANSKKVITSYSDIDGPVLDRDGNEVLSLEDVSKGLVDRFGKPLGTLTSKILKKAASAAWGATKFAAKSALWLGKKGLDLALSPIKLAASLGKGVGSGVKEKLGLRSPFGSRTENTIEKIYQLLDERMPGKRNRFDMSGDGLRDGSWQEIRAARKAKAAEANKKKGKGKEEGEKKESGSGILGMIMGKLGTMLAPLAGLKTGLTSLTELLGKGLGKLAVGTATKGAAAALGTASVAGKVVGGTARTALALGRGALTVGGWALRLLPMLANPVALGALAAGAAVYGGYKLYKWYSKRFEELSKLRYIQYGVNPEDKARMELVQGLESKIMETTTIARDGTMTMGKLDFDSILSDFGLDPDQKDRVEAWARWFNYRFLRVFQIHWKALNSMDAALGLEKVDELPDSLKTSFAEKVVTDVPADVLNMADSPFPDNKPIITGRVEVDAMLAYIQKRFKSAEKDKAKVSLVDSSGTVRSAVNPVTGIRDVSKQRSTSRMSFVDQATADANKERVIKAGGFVWDKNQTKTIDALNGIKLRAYGLVDLDMFDSQAIINLEREAAAAVTFGVFGGAKFNSDSETWFKKHGPRFGCSLTDDNQRVLWKYWFDNRFIPVLLAYMTALRAVDRMATVDNAWTTLVDKDKVTVANAIIAAKAEVDGNDVSIWSVDASPFPGKPANLDSASTNAAMESLKQKVKDNRLKETYASKKAADKDKALNESWAKRMTAQQGGNGYGASRPFDSSTFGSGSGPYGPGNVGSGTMAGGPANYGRQVEHPGNGSGGDVNSLPVPKGDGYSNVKALLQEVAKMTGVDPALLTMMCAVESDFKIGAKAGTSSAGGLFQFIDDTWNAMLSKYGSKYGLAPGTSKFDPRANALLGAEYIRENYNYLSKKIGRQPTENDLYMAHFFGPAGAEQVLTGNPDDVAARLNPKAADANPTIFFEGGGKGRARTVREVIADIGSRIDAKVKRYGIAANETAKAGTDPNPEDIKTSNPDLPLSTGLNNGPGLPKGGPGDFQTSGQTPDGEVPVDPNKYTNVKQDSQTGNQNTAGGSGASVATPNLPPRPTAVNQSERNARKQDSQQLAMEEQQRKEKAAAVARQTRIADKEKSIEKGNVEILKAQASSLLSIDETLKAILAKIGTQSETGKTTGTKATSPDPKRSREILPDTRPSPITMGRS